MYRIKSRLCNLRVAMIAWWLLVGVVCILLKINRSVRWRTSSHRSSSPQYALTVADASPHLTMYNIGNAVPAGEEEMECINHSLVANVKVCLFPDESDSYISANLRKYGYWNKDIVTEFIKALNEYPDAGVLDLGAHIGQYSLVAAGMGHRVVAVEPTLPNIIRLHKAASLSRVTDRIQVVQNVVVDHRDPVTLQLIRQNQGGNFICGTSHAPQECDDRPILNANSVLLNDIVPLLQDLKVVIVKMDIEGSEHRALVHSKLLFEQFNIPYVFMEWVHMIYLYLTAPDPDTRQLVARIVSSFTDMGYKAYPVPYNNIALDPNNFTEWPEDIMWKKEKGE